MRARNVTGHWLGYRHPKEMRRKYPVGTRFQIYAKLTDREGGGLNGFEFVDADSPPSRWATRLACLDLRWPLRRKYDKRAGRIMLRDFRIHYFGKHRRLTKERCEEFFSNDANFIDV
jgi:hypothetical protein